MASIPCSFYVDVPPFPSAKVAPAPPRHPSSSRSPSPPSSGQLKSLLLGLKRKLGSLAASPGLGAKVGSSCCSGGRAGRWFKFGSRGGGGVKRAGIRASQQPPDGFGGEDVEQIAETSTTECQRPKTL